VATTHSSTTAENEPTVSLKELLEQSISGKLETLVSQQMGHWVLDDERWSAHSREHSVADIARQREAYLTDKALQAADLARGEALRVAAESFNAYKTSSNEFRGTLEDQAAHFVTKSEHDAVTARITTLENDRIARDAAALTAQTAASAERDRERSDRSRAQWVVGILVTFVAIVVSAIVGVLIRALGL
jgi:hypothetical protein